MQENAQPAVVGVHHLAIQVRDLPGAERFYVEALGLRVLQRWPWPPEAAGRQGDRSVWVSVGPGDAQFLALEACDESPPDTAFRDPRGGLHLLALRIAPGERARWEERLARLGIEVVHRSRWTLYLRDPEGNRVGLSHHPEDG